MPKKYFSYFALLIFSVVSLSSPAKADVCLSDKEAIDVVALLDASEREIEVLGSCERLVKELYGEIEKRDQRLLTITKQLVTAKQDAIRYQEEATRWKRVAWYTSAGGIVLLVIQVLPHFI